MNNHEETVITLFVLALLLRLYTGGNLQQLWAASTGSSGGATVQSDIQHAFLRLVAIAIILAVLLGLGDSEAWPIAVWIEILAIFYLLLHSLTSGSLNVAKLFAFLSPQGSSTTQQTVPTQSSAGISQGLGNGQSSPTSNGILWG